MDAREGNRRKRKSRFSDAVDTPDGAPASQTQRDAATPLDPAALAKLAAAKISRAIPGGTATGGGILAATATALPTTTDSRTAAVGGSSGDVDEQIRIAEEKRRRTDQIYKSVQAQMSHIKALLRKPGEGTSNNTAATGSAAIAGTTVGGTFMPAPLLLDEHGRQVDEAGNVIAENLPVPVATLKANKSTTRSSTQPKQNANPYLSHRTVDKEDAVDAVDPRLNIKKRETYVVSHFVMRSCITLHSSLTLFLFSLQYM